MLINDPCSGCAQKHDCKSIYRTLGDNKGPSVVWKVVLVFLVPIAVFVTSTAVCGYFLKERIGSEPVRTAVTFGLAVLMSMLSAGLVRLVVPAWGRPGRCDSDRNDQNEHPREKDI